MSSRIKAPPATCHLVWSLPSMTQPMKLLQAAQSLISRPHFQNQNLNCHQSHHLMCQQSNHQSFHQRNRLSQHQKFCLPSLHPHHCKGHLATSVYDEPIINNHLAQERKHILRSLQLLVPMMRLEVKPLL